jgi:preprotein translocase SecE subunit
MRTYREDQGRLTRMFAFWATVAMVYFGCTFLYSQLFQYVEALRPALGGLQVPLISYDLNGALVISMLVFAGGAFGAHRYLNRGDVVETLVDTETELKKVTWPTFEETLNASLVVVAFVLILMGFLWLSDRVLESIFARLLGLGG